MTALNLDEIRRIFRSRGNVVLRLCDELEQQRAATAALAQRVVELTGPAESLLTLLETGGYTTEQILEAQAALRAVMPKEATR